MKNNNKTDNIEDTLGVGKSKKSLFRYWWWLIIILGIGFAVFFTMTQSEPIVKYKTVHPQQKDLISTVSATGNLEPTNRVDIGIEVSGTISEVLVDYNDVVKKGQVLARLDTIKLESKVNSAKASLQGAEANLQESKLSMNNAKSELNRVERLFKSTGGNYPSRKEIDTARVLYEKSKASSQALMAQVEQASAVLKSNEDDLKKAVVISPIDGIVLDKLIETGQSVVASMQVPTLFTLAEDLKKMEVVVSVDEADVGSVKKGQSVSFTVDAYPNKIFQGVIEQVRMNSQIVNNVVTYQTVVTVDNAELLLRPGMTVSADITTKVIKNALQVPNSALRFTPPVVEVKENKGFNLFGRPSRKPKTPINVNDSQLWILEKKEATPINVEFGESDGVNTVVLSDNLTTKTEVILSIVEKRK